MANRDVADELRRVRLIEINQAPAGRAVLQARHGRVWSPAELVADFEVVGYLAPFVVVRRRADGLVGSLEFQHEPRFNFRFEPDRKTPGEGTTRHDRTDP